ncbi:TetR/AcrR family transcriptional regulator [Kineosporia babensis]|uniref:TetR family transcriptional regulator n=1 Tax=Kineosporia babensis TaxID=499548 RepID=A0A9X1NIG7_9ACTN|nr:TetR/AcrR family transcriptional regulator [Kineosporia babensis]MCD5314660.1 TetR family transcriptional regulator [Kineosporia babensis]
MATSEAVSTGSVRPSKARERLLRTASALFYSEGIHEVGVDRILGEAEVTRSTFYRHFPGKEDLVLSYIRAMDSAVRSHVEAAVAGGADLSIPSIGVEVGAASVVAGDEMGARSGEAGARSSATEVGSSLRKAGSGGTKAGSGGGNAGFSEAEEAGSGEAEARVEAAGAQAEASTDGAAQPGFGEETQPSSTSEPQPGSRDQTQPGFVRPAQPGSEAAAGGGNKASRSLIEALIDEHTERICQPGFRGCAFINAAAEYPSADSPVRQAIEEHRSWMLATATDAFRRAGHPAPDRAGRRFMLLRDGAMISGYLHDPEAARATLREGVEDLLTSGRSSS